MGGHSPPLDIEVEEIVRGSSEVITSTYDAAADDDDRKVGQRKSGDMKKKPKNQSDNKSDNDKLQPIPCASPKAKHRLSRKSESSKGSGQMNNFNVIDEESVDQNSMPLEKSGPFEENSSNSDSDNEMEKGFMDDGMDQAASTLHQSNDQRNFWNKRDLRTDSVQSSLAFGTESLVTGAISDQRPGKSPDRLARRRQRRQQEEQNSCNPGCMVGFFGPKQDSKRTTRKSETNKRKGKQNDSIVDKKGKLH